MSSSLVAAFDYTMLAPELVEPLRRQASRIRERGKATVSAIIEIGRDLLAVQKHLQHGQFCTWVEAECGFTVRSAQNYMRAAEFAEDKNEIISLLSPTTLYMLAAKSSPTEIVTDVVARFKAGEVLADTTIKTRLAEAGSERREAAAKARLSRRKAKLSPRTLRRHEAEERKNQEAREKRRRAAKAKAIGIIEKFGLEGARFLLEVYRDPEANFYNVIEHIESAINGAGQ
jgi:hypothetical protein